MRGTFYEVRGKRVFDVVFGSLLVPLWGLLYLLIVASILLFDRLPLHYRSVRMGREGREITVLKFRTMRRDAYAVLAEFLASDPSMAQEISTTMKLRRDPRVTAPGRILRRLRLDQLAHGSRHSDANLSVVLSGPGAF